MLSRPCWDVKSRLVDTDDKKRAWARAGIIPFDRRTSDAPVSKWPNHGHVVVAGCTHRTPSAKEQEKAARLGRNALRNDKPFRGNCGPIITWQEALDQQSDVVVVTPEIPRCSTPKPWPLIAEDGKLGPRTMDRLRMQLDLAPTGSGQWSHWDVDALLLWLCEPCTKPAVISAVAVLKLQYRVKTKADGNWGPVTTRALQKYLNKYR